MNVITKSTFVAAMLASTALTAFGQCTINPVAVSGVVLDGITIGNAGISVAYNPNADLYYTVEGGSPAMSIVTFNSTGLEVATGANANFDFRGVWWNPNLNQLECNGYSTTGIRVNDLDASQYALSTGPIVLAAAQPDAQSMGDYDWDADEIIYFNGGTVYRYDRLTNTLQGSYPVTGLPVGFGNLSTYAIGYTGCPGQEIVLFDLVANAAYVVNKSTGAYVATSTMPGGAVTSSSWYDYSFCNNQMFIRSGNDWYGYHIFEQCTGLATTVSATEVCEGEQVTLSASGTGTVTWDNGVTSGVSFTPPVGTTTYTATSTEPNECSYSVDITSYVMPSVDAGSDMLNCASLADITLSATGVADTFVWNNGVEDAVPFSPNVGQTTYIVTAINNAFGCQVTDTISVTIGNPGISLTAFDEVLGNDGAVTLTINSGIPPYVFDWDNDGVGDNDDDNDIFGLPAGTYTVTMTDGSGCSVTESINVGGVGLNEIGLNISLFPNPTTGKIIVSVPGTYDYQLNNFLGQNIQSGIIADSAELDLSDLAPGSYMIRLMSNDGIWNVNVIKE